MEGLSLGVAPHPLRPWRVGLGCIQHIPRCRRGGGLAYQL